MTMVAMILVGCVAWGLLAGQIGTCNSWNKVQMY